MFRRSAALIGAMLGLFAGSAEQMKQEFKKTEDSIKAFNDAVSTPRRVRFNQLDSNYFRNRKARRRARRRIARLARRENRP